MLISCSFSFASLINIIVSLLIFLIFFMNPSILAKFSCISLMRFDCSIVCSSSSLLLHLYTWCSNSKMSSRINDRRELWVWCNYTAGASISSSPLARLEWWWGWAEEVPDCWWSWLWRTVPAESLLVGIICMWWSRPMVSLVNSLVEIWFRKPGFLLLLWKPN